jgi:hypothetical protein
MPPRAAPATVNNLNRINAILTTAALLALAAGPALAQPDDDAPPVLPAACEATLRALHAEFTAHRATLPPAAAALALQTRAGPACGFDLTGRTPTTANETALRRFVEGLGDARREKGPGDLSDLVPGSPDLPDPTRLVGGTPDPRTGANPTDGPAVGDATREVVPCSMSGSGPGTLTATILGIAWPFTAAQGAWQAPGGVKEVSGATTGVSGDQSSLAGSIVFAALPISSVGEPSISCLKITTVTGVDEGCDAGWLVTPIWGHVGAHCHQTVETASKIQPCGAAVSQSAIGSLILATHAYKVANPPEGC